MQYLNPIRILNLSQLELSEITDQVIRKAKRVLFADIDLSDEGLFRQDSNSFTKSDLEAAINQIENKDVLEYFYFIARNNYLENFLSRNDPKFITEFRTDAMFLLPEFKEFVSPFYSKSFNQVLRDAYINNDERLFKKCNSLTLLIKQDDFPTAYSYLTKLLRDSVNELDKITATLRNKTPFYTKDNISLVLGKYRRELSAQKVNYLPAVFQELINQIALSFRNFSINVYNFFDDSDLAIEIISYSLRFETSAHVKDGLATDLDEISELRQKNVKNKQNEELTNKYVDILKKGRAIVDGVDNLTFTGSAALSWVYFNVSVSDINSLDSYFDDLRTDFALFLRSLSVSVWNKWDDATSSIAIIESALKINSIEQEVRTKLLDDKNTLIRLKNAAAGTTVSRAISSTPSQNTPAGPRLAQQSPKANYPVSNQNRQGDSSITGIIFFGVIILMIIIYAVSKNTNSSSSNSSQSNYAMADSSKIADTTKMVADTTKHATANLMVPDSTKMADSAKMAAAITTDSSRYGNRSDSSNLYTGNSLVTGSSPYINCFSKSVFANHSYILFNNDSSNDAIVSLIDAVTDRVIRHKYIKSGGYYKMREIPSGTYYFEIYSGNNWNPNMLIGCGAVGGFNSNAQFSSSRSIYKDLEATEYGNQYSYFNVDLSKIINSYSSNIMTSSTFFNHNTTNY